jgi:DNA-binding transcriptional LysR family regulator
VVSRALGRLRILLDDPLLVRKLGGMVLTPRAEALREPLARWLADGEALMRPSGIHPATLRRTFRIASTDFGVISVIEPTLTRIAETAPSVGLLISPLSLEAQRELNEGQLDLIVTGFAPDPSAVHARRLFSESYLCLVRREHPVLDHHPLSFDAFLEWPHIAVTVLGQEADGFDDRQREARREKIILWTPDFSLSPMLVRDTNAIVTLPARAARRFAADHDLAVFDPPGEMTPFDYWLVWHERSQRDPATQWLIDQLVAPFRTSSPLRPS